MCKNSHSGNATCLEGGHENQMNDWKWELGFCRSPEQARDQMQAQKLLLAENLQSVRLGLGRSNKMKLNQLLLLVVLLLRLSVVTLGKGGMWDRCYGGIMMTRDALCNRHKQKTRIHMKIGAHSLICSLFRKEVSYALCCPYL